MLVKLGRLRRLIRESLLNAQDSGLWITPRGEVIKVGPGELHVDAAEKALGMSDEDAGPGLDPDEIWVLQGAIKIRFWPAGRHNPSDLSIVTRGFSAMALQRIQDALTDAPLSPNQAVTLFDGGNMIKTTFGILMAARKPRDLN